MPIHHCPDPHWTPGFLYVCLSFLHSFAASSQGSRALDGHGRASKMCSLSGPHVSTELPVKKDTAGNGHLLAKKETRGDSSCLVLCSGGVTASVAVT